MDYPKNDSYFNHSYSLAGFIAGFVLLIAGLTLLTHSVLTLYQTQDIDFTAARFLILIPLTFFVIPGALAVTFNIPRKTISDLQYDSSAEGYAFKLMPHALDALRISKSDVNEEVPIILGGYAFEEADKVKQGADGKWRSNIYKVIIMFFSQDKIYSYTKKFATTRKLEAEQTVIYPYRDVNSVSIERQLQRALHNGRDTIITVEAFKLIARGGTQLLTVNVMDSKHAHEAVSTMRSLLLKKELASQTFFTSR